MNRLICVLMMVLLGSASLFVSAATSLKWDDKEFMGVDEIRPGMIGYGKTVYQGTKVETFGVKVIGVLKRADFSFDMILIQVLDGPVVERKLQTVSGMSGSPIYINGRLIGAYAYGWDFQQEAVAGVTPIAAMLDCTQPGSARPPAQGTLVPKNQVLRIGEKLITNVRVVPSSDDPAAQRAKSDPTTMVLSPLATPVFANGFSDRAITAIQGELDPYHLRAMPGPGSVDGPAPSMEPGSAVAVSLMSGDVELNAVGTVTYVRGDTVLAFGHPFFGIGKVDIPMSVAYVHGIINSAASSFKMASPIGNAVGTLTSDRQYAVAGVLGQQPTTIPIALNLTDPSRNYAKQYRVRMISHPNFTPAFLLMYVIWNGASQMADIMSDIGTFSARAVIATEQFGDIEQQMAYAPESGVMSLPLGETYELLSLLMLNPYETVKVKGITMDIAHSPERKIAMIEQVSADRHAARSGETVNLAVRVRPFGKPVETHHVAVKVPENTVDQQMVVLVAGGAYGMDLKALTAPLPVPEEGVQGLVRWYTDIPAAQSIVTVRVLPSPSYAYRGHFLTDLPDAVLDMVRFMENGPYTRGENVDASQEGDGGGASGPNIRPTTATAASAIPYVLTGAQLVSITIDGDERMLLPPSGNSPPSPVLSGGMSPLGGDDGESQRATRVSLLTPGQRARYEALRASMLTRHATVARPTLPRWQWPVAPPLIPLSAGDADDAASNIEITEPDDTAAGEGEEEQSAGEDGSETSDAQEEKPSTQKAGERALLSRKRFTWVLGDRRAFMRGIHMGTAITNKGHLVLTPAVKSVLSSSEFVPWKLTTTADASYVAGWNSPTITRINRDGTNAVVFPRQARDGQGIITISALASNAKGNLLVGCWPDHTVRLINPEGAVLRQWTLPATMIWDVAVASDGTYYAACDGGAVYRLREETDADIQLACTVPDRNVYTLLPGGNGMMFLGTAPRGKVYCLSPQGHLTSVFESVGAVSSMTFDAKGNLYIGSSPSCRVIRVTSDGTQREIFRGQARNNRHVMALTMIGDTLFAATGPAGGIYRISNPEGPEPEITPIFARADTRLGREGDALPGPESVMVNALSVTPEGGLLVAASSPSQVLRLEPRTSGAYLTPVLSSQGVTRWGRLEAHSKLKSTEGVAIESRGGNTSIPDATWSPWMAVPLSSGQIESVPSTSAQFRITLIGESVGLSSPVVDYLRVGYLPHNTAPQLKLAQPAPGTVWRGRQQLRWQGQDVNEDELVYTVFLSTDDGVTWKRTTPAELKSAGGGSKPGKTASATGKAGKGAPVSPSGKAEKPDGEYEVRVTSLPFETKSLPDGVTYRIKVVATDQYAQPQQPLTAEVISGRFAIDNTSPVVILPDKAKAWADVARFQVIDNTSPIAGGRFKVGNSPWRALVPGDGIFDTQVEYALLSAPSSSPQLPTGTHKVVVQIEDVAGNSVERTVTITIPAAPAKAAEGATKEKAATP